MVYPASRRAGRLATSALRQAAVRREGGAPRRGLRRVELAQPLLATTLHSFAGRPTRATPTTSATRRIASPDLLPGEHRCLRIPATEGRHDVDDQSASAAGVGGGGDRAVSAEHASREGADPGRVRRAHRVPPQARHPSPERKLGSVDSTAGAPVCVRRSRDRGAGRAVGGIGPRVREASEGVAADPGAGTRAARARDPGPAGTRATDGGERRHDRPPPGVREGGDGPVSAGAVVPGATAYGAGFQCARSGIGRIRRRASSRPISSRTVDRRWLAASSGRWC